MRYALVLAAVLLTGCVTASQYAIYEHPVTKGRLACEKLAAKGGIGVYGLGDLPYITDYNTCKENLEDQGYVRIETTSSARPAASSGRYQPCGGGGRRIRRRASRAPRRSRMRPIVRTDGTRAWPRAMSSRWRARAPYSPRSLVSLSSRRTPSTRSSIAASVRWTDLGIGDRSLQSDRKSVV